MLTSFALGHYTKDKYASSLRAEQNRQWAAKHVHLGIKHFKSGNKIEAFQSLNQALNIDPKNVEGLVARGKETCVQFSELLGGEIST